MHISDKRFNNIGFVGLDYRSWKSLVEHLISIDKVLRVGDDGIVYIDIYREEEDAN